MVTADEIAAVPLFASLGPARARAAVARGGRPAARRRRVRGEPGRRACALRAARRARRGRARHRRDRAHRRRRYPGEIFGEVPITLGTVFPVGFRAVEPSRVMRIEPHEYHAVAALAPDLGEEVGELALERIGGGGASRGSWPTRRLRARPCSAAGSTPRARSSAGSSTATGSRSRGCGRVARRGAGVGRAAAARGRLAGDPRRRRHDRGPAAAAHAWPSWSAS